MKHNYLKQLKSGILDQNPTLVQLLGMCPTLATTTSLKNAFGMGMAATAVLICSNVFISLLRKFIPKQVRIAAYIVIVSGFVTAVELLMRTYMVSLYRSLGLFIPLIVVNCIILARAEAFASKNPPLPSAMDGLSMGLGFTFALCILGTVRELLGSGSLLGHRILPEAYPDMVIFILPAGAFLTLGFTIAAVQKIKNTVEEKKRRAAEDGKEEQA
jgi:electron transport complex protein RnfE